MKGRENAAPSRHEARGGCLRENYLQSGRFAMPTPDAAGDLGQHCTPTGQLHWVEGYPPSPTHIHLEPQKVTLFGNRTFVDAIS